MNTRTDSLFAPSAAKAQHEKRLFALNVLLFGCVFVVFSIFAPIRFETNDDVVMLLIASGAYTGTPDPHLVFINILLGHVLSLLYSNFKGIEFYTCFLLAVHIWSSASIASFIQRQNLPRLLTAAFLLLLLAFELLSLANLQFTTSSGILALAAVVRQFQALPKISWVAVCAFGLASCIRFEAAILVLGLSFPWLVQKHVLLRSITVILVFVLTAGLLKAVDAFSYSSDPGWHAYREYLDVRIKINDNPNDHHFKSESSAEQNDYLLTLAFLPNPASIKIDRLKEISQKLQQVPLDQKIRNIAPALMVYKNLLILLFAALFILVAQTTGYTRYQILSVTMIYILFLLYLPLNNILKPRVFWVSIAPILFICGSYATQHIKSKVWLLGLFGILLLISLGIFYKAAYSLRANVKNTPIISEQMSLMKAYYANHQKPLFGIQLNGEFLHPFSMSDQLADQKFIFGGWLTKIPFPGHLRSYEELLQKSLLVQKDDIRTTVPMMIRSLKDNHNKNVTHAVVLESERYAILEFVER